MYLKHINKKPKIYGWDIGGAHIKVCKLVEKHGSLIVQVIQVRSSLWKGMKYLIESIEHIKKKFKIEKNDIHFFTMSGEMADCFSDRKDGVIKITDVIGGIFETNISFYCQKKKFLKKKFGKNWKSVASANWHATANYVSSIKKNAIIVDIGSTTTDLIPILNNRIVNKNADDSSRLQSGELVYLGVTRTSVSSINPQLLFKNKLHNVMRESFCNTADVFRLTKDLKEKFDLYPTFDKKPKTLFATEQRIARVIGMDRKNATSNEWKKFANNIKKRMIKELVKNITKVEIKYDLDGKCPLVVAGCGSFLAYELSKKMERDKIFFNELVSTEYTFSKSQKENIDTCAPAVSLAILAKKK